MFLVGDNFESRGFRLAGDEVVVPGLMNCCQKGAAIQRSILHTTIGFEKKREKIGKGGSCLLCPRKIPITRWDIANER